MEELRKSLFEGEDVNDYSLDGQGRLEKAKRVWVKPTGRKKGYFRTDPREKKPEEKPEAKEKKPAKQPKLTEQHIKDALEGAGLRQYVEAIEENPATPGEVVLWMGGSGSPVYSAQQAVKLVREHKSSEE